MEFIGLPILEKMIITLHIKIEIVSKDKTLITRAPLDKEEALFHPILDKIYLVTKNTKYQINSNRPCSSINRTCSRTN